MKKYIVIAIITVVLALTLCACTVNININQADYDKLTSMLDATYSGWTLTVKTSSSNVELENKFVITKEAEHTTIEYKIEELGLLSMDSDSEFKVEHKGSAVVKDGKIVSLNGEEVDVQLEKLETIGLTFKSDYFENVKMTDSAIQADVKDPSGFLGTDISCTDMKLVAGFGSSFNYIRITYKANGADVEYNYEFGNK